MCNADLSGVQLRDGAAWRSAGYAAMIDLTPLTAAVELLEQRVAALKQDRDYWRRQHDLVMADWKEDLARLGDGKSLGGGDKPT